MNNSSGFSVLSNALVNTCDAASDMFHQLGSLPVLTNLSGNWGLAHWSNLIHDNTTSEVRS